MALDTSLDAALCPPSQESGARRWPILFTAIFLVAFLARLPYYATHHVQEDAYITFRAAFHLADHGDYSFNLAGHSTGVTSTLYGPYIACIRLIFHTHTIMAISVLNTLIFLAGAALLSLGLFRNWRKRLLFFSLIALLPSGLLMSYAGMEIPLQTAAFCAALFTLRYGHPRWTTLAFVLVLPLIRPDAIAYSLILTVLVFSFDKLYGALALAASASSILLILGFNRIVSGSFLTPTMMAKEIAYHPGHKLIEILYAAYRGLIAHSYLLPVESKYLDVLSPFITLLLLAGCAYAVWLARQQTIAFRLLLACFAAVVLVPGAYFIGEVLFPWYFWTPNWLCDVLICYAAVLILFAAESPGKRIAWLALFAAMLLIMDTAQWLVSYNIGLQEYHYRGDVGRWLHQVAQPTDTLGSL